MCGDKLESTLCSLERKLSEIERAYSLSHRWLPTDHEYTENQRRDILHKREQLLLVLGNLPNDVCSFSNSSKNMQVCIAHWLHYTRINFVQKDKRCFLHRSAKRV